MLLNSSFASIERLLADSGLANECGKPGSREFYVTDLPAKVSEIGKMFLGIDDLKIELARLG